MSKIEKYAISSYLNSWQNYISDLELMYNSRELVQGKEAAMTLAFCYMEALGKLVLFEAGKACPPPTSRFIQALKLFDTSLDEKYVRATYKLFRCDPVHSGPTLRSSQIINSNGEIVEIDFEWCSRVLIFLLDQVKIKYENLPFIDIAKAIEWK